MGRPSSYTDELAAEICSRIAAGQSVREIGRSEDMPAMGTIFRWLSDREAFREQYARAKEAQAELMAEEILDIADDATNDWMTRLNQDGSINKSPNGDGQSFNAEHVQRSKLRIDSRKWLLSKLLPKKYGEKVTQEIGGVDGGPVTLRWLNDSDPD